MQSSTKNKSLVLALVGESGAGKTTTTAMIAEMGFAPIALAKHLRETAIDKFGVPARSQVQNLARETQARHGDDYYAKVALSDPAFESASDIVIDGLRNVAELDYTKHKVRQSGRDFFMLAVMASDDTRFARVVSRGRGGDPLERERFDADDARARGSAEDGFQQNGILIGMAEHTLYNTGDLTDLKESIKRAIAVARNTRALEDQQ